MSMKKRLSTIADKSSKLSLSDPRETLIGVSKQVKMRTKVMKISQWVLS
jgi:hypothetical protein